MLFPSASLRAETIDGLLVILDLRNDSYSVLDDVGTAFWKALTRPMAQADRVDQLSRAFSAPCAAIVSDLDAFTLDCVARGWLARLPPPPSAPPRRIRRAARPTVLNAGRALLEAVAFYARIGVAPSRISAETTRDHALKAFLAAENFIPLPGGLAECLARSLALFAFLRRCGVTCHHLIGVRRTPFEAHAWVEIDGEPVLEKFDQHHLEVLAKL